MTAPQTNRVLAPDPPSSPLSVEVTGVCHHTQSQPVLIYSGSTQSHDKIRIAVLSKTTFHPVFSGPSPWMAHEKHLCILCPQCFSKNQTVNIQLSFASGKSYSVVLQFFLSHMFFPSSGKGEVPKPVIFKPLPQGWGRETVSVFYTGEAGNQA